MSKLRVFLMHLCVSQQWHCPDQAVDSSDFQRQDLPCLPAYFWQHPASQLLLLRHWLGTPLEYVPLLCNAIFLFFKPKTKQNKKTRFAFSFFFQPMVPLLMSCSRLCSQLWTTLPALGLTGGATSWPTSWCALVEMELCPAAMWVWCTLYLFIYRRCHCVYILLFHYNQW